MRITRALVPAAAVALALASSTAAAPTKPAPALRLVPITFGYTWAQPGPLAITTLTPLTLAQLPILTTYAWAQPKTAPQHVLHGQPWSL